MTRVNNLATAYFTKGSVAKSAELFEEVCRVRRKKLGPRHSETLRSLSNLATAYLALGRTDDAIGVYHEVLEARISALGANHRDVARTLVSLGDAHRQAGRVDEAIELFQQTVAMRKAVLPPGHPETIAALGLLGSALLESKRLADAGSVLRECLALRNEKDRDGWRRFQTMSQLGAALSGQKKYTEAERPLIDGFDGLRAREEQIPAREKGELAAACARIPPMYEALGRPALADEWRQRLATDVKGSP